MNFGNSGDRVKYVTIFDSKFTIRVPAGTEGSVVRKLIAGKNEGKEVSELSDGNMSGRITSIEYKQKEFCGKNIETVEVNLVNDETYQLQFSWNSSVKTSLISRLPNVDFTKDVTFSVFKDDKKDRAVLVIYQGDQLIPSAYTKDNPNGMPAAIEKTERGVTKWDFSEVEEFLYGVLMEQKARLEAIVNGGN